MVHCNSAPKCIHKCVLPKQPVCCNAMAVLWQFALLPPPPLDSHTSAPDPSPCSSDPSHTAALHPTARARAARGGPLPGAARGGPRVKGVQIRALPGGPARALCSLRLAWYSSARPLDTRPAWSTSLWPPGVPRGLRCTDLTPALLEPRVWRLAAGECVAAGEGRASHFDVVQYKQQEYTATQHNLGWNATPRIQYDDAKHSATGAAVPCTVVCSSV